MKRPATKEQRSGSCDRSPAELARVPSPLRWRTVRLLASTQAGDVAALFRLGTLSLFFFGAMLGVLVRIEHLAPTPTILMPEPFYRLLTLHGLTLLFWVLLPAVTAGIGVARLPALLGVENLAWPRILRGSFHAWLAGTLCLAGSVLLGGPDSGAMLRPPLSTTGSAASAVAAAGVGCVVCSAGMVAGCILRTVQRYRPRDLPWFDLPLLVTTLECSSALTMVGAPVLASAVFTLALDRASGVGWFTHAGGEIWYTHLFWFGTRPAMVGVVLVSIGVLGDLIHSRQGGDIPRRRWASVAVVAAAALSVLGWGEHLLTTDLSVRAAAVFSAFGMLLGVPFGVIAVALVLSLRSLAAGRDATSLYVYSATWFLLLGLSSGAASAAMSVNVYLHGTLFVVSHLHCLALGTVVSSWFGGLLHYWPVFHRAQPDPQRLRAGALLYFLGTNFLLLPGFVQGARGRIRGSYDYPLELRPMEIVASVGSWMLGLGLLLTFFALATAARRGPASPSAQACLAQDPAKAVP